MATKPEVHRVHVHLGMDEYLRLDDMRHRLAQASRRRVTMREIVALALQEFMERHSAVVADTPEVPAP